MVQKTTDLNAFHEFLGEIKILTFIGKHANIVEFIGVVAEEMSPGECK